MSATQPLASSDANALNNNADGQKILADLSKSDDDASSLNYSVATDNNLPPAEESGVAVSGGLAAAAGLAAVNSTDDLADAADPLEDDVVLTHRSSSPRKLLTSRPALLLALLAILIIGLSVGLSNKNNGANNATATGGSGADIEVKAATAAAVPKKDANNNKKDGNKEPVPAPIVPGTPVPTDQSTPFPTNQGTETVGIDASFGPTTPPRDSDWRKKNRRVNVIQSPTWHG
jgi:hypothetical protein